MLNQATAHVPIDLPVRTRGVPNGKVVRPPLEVPIQLANQAHGELLSVHKINQAYPGIPTVRERLAGSESPNFVKHPTLREPAGGLIIAGTVNGLPQL